MRSGEGRIAIGCQERDRRIVGEVSMGLGDLQNVILVVPLRVSGLSVKQSEIIRTL